MFISLDLLWGPYHDDHLILHQVICSRGRFFRFLKVTTGEKKIGVLLIETFKTTKWWPPGFNPWWPFLLNLRLAFVLQWIYLNRKRGLKGKGGRLYASLWSAWPLRKSHINLKVDKARIIVVGWSDTDSHDGNRKDNKWSQSTSESFGVLWFYGDC